MRDSYASGLRNISDIQCKCDLLTLDNTLDNEYASHFLSGKSLLIDFATWSHTNQSTGNDKNLSANIHRALSRLKPVFVTLNIADSMQYKEANIFYHPIAAKLNGGYDIEDEHSLQVQSGSKIMPEYPLSPVTETRYQLGKNCWSSPSYLWPVVPFASLYYRTGFRNISGAGFIGLSTKSGDQITLNFNKCDAEGWTASVPTRMYCALHYDAVLNTHDSGVQVLD